MGSRAQRVQAVQGVLSPVSSSCSSQWERLLSLRVPAVSKTTVSDTAASLAGRLLQNLPHARTSTRTHRRLEACQLFRSCVCVFVWHMRVSGRSPRSNGNYVWSCHTFLQTHPELLSTQTHMLSRGSTHGATSLEYLIVFYSQLYHPCKTALLSPQPSDDCVYRLEREASHKHINKPWSHFNQHRYKHAKTRQPFSNL